MMVYHLIIKGKISGVIMGRNKDYDRHKVLEKAVGVFWQKGYKACSMTDIVSATELNTASLYKEFGDKDGLFEEALDYYRQHITSRRFQILIDEPNLKGVENFLKDIISGASSETYKGCFMMNHLAQKHSISSQAVQKIDDYCITLENLLETAFRNAQANGETSTSKDPAVLASFVVFCAHGVALYGRHPNKKNEIHNLYDVILQALVE